MLTDSYNRIHDYLRISITQKCNFRCSYCIPVDLPKGYYAGMPRMSAEEIDRIVSVFVKEGVKKIRLTGGEPLLRRDAGDIIRRLSRYPVELTLTTNGYLIREYLDILKESGIRSLNVSLDSLDPVSFSRIAGRDYLRSVTDNILLLLQSGIHVKINTVVMRGVNHHEVTDFVELTRRNPLHVRFIEFMPFNGNQWDGEKVFPAEGMLELISSRYSFIKLKDELHDTARKYKVPGFEGTFATISTMSAPFCAGCNRLRLTSDGKMKNCLFSKGEADILGTLREGGDILPVIRSCLFSKAKETGGQLLQDYRNINSVNLENRSMIHIGG